MQSLQRSVRLVASRTRTWPSPSFQMTVARKSGPKLIPDLSRLSAYRNCPSCCSHLHSGTGMQGEGHLPPATKESIATAISTKTGPGITPLITVYSNAISHTSSAAGKKGDRKRRGSQILDWPTEMDAKILEMRLEGSSWQEIGEAVGRDDKACHSRYAKVINPALKDGWTPERISLLNELVESCRSWSEVSRTMGLTSLVCKEKWYSVNKQPNLRPFPRQQVLSEDPDQLGLRETIARRQSSWDEPTDSALVTLLERGLSWRQIGFAMGRVPMTCYLRYTTKVKPALNEGWKPTIVAEELMPSYLLRGRIFSAGMHGEATTGARMGLGTWWPISTSSDPSSQRLDSSIDFSDHQFPYITKAISLDYSTKSLPTSSKIPWSAEEDKAILIMKAEEKSWRTISDKLKRGSQECYQRYYTALAPELERKWTKRMIEKLFFYVDNGLSWSMIGANLGLNRLTCKEKWKQFSSRKPNLSPIPSSSIISDTLTTTPASTSATYPASIGVMNKGLSEVANLEHLDSNGDDGHELDENQVQGMFNDTDHDLEEMEQLTDQFDRDETMASENDTSSGSWLQKRDTGAICITADELLEGRYPELLRTNPCWTVDEETILIRSVLQHGTQKWKNVANAVGGNHSEEDCKQNWKILDMPVRHLLGPQSTDPWPTKKQAQFWNSWLKYGSDFGRIASQLPGKSTSDCKEYFEAMSNQLPKDPELYQTQVHNLAVSISRPARYVWDKAQSVMLQKLLRQKYRNQVAENQDWINWKWVSRLVGNGVTPSICMFHWRYLSREFDKPWGEQEVKCLEQGIRDLGDKRWRTIQRFYLPQRSMKDIQQKWYLLSEKATKVNEEEYYYILKAVEGVPEAEWETKLAKEGIPTGWTRAPAKRILDASYLRQVQQHGKIWSKEKDKTLEKAVELNGEDWGGIAKYFPGLTGWQCRLRWCELLNNKSFPG